MEEIRNLSEAVTTLKGDQLLEDEIQELKEEREEHREVSRVEICCSKYIGNYLKILSEHFCFFTIIIIFCSIDLIFCNNLYVL